MVTIDSGIVLDFPPTWERFTEGSRCVFHTPRSEEVIVSARRLIGDGAADERALSLDRMVEGGLEAALRGATSPELRVIRPLAEDSQACALRCWTVMTETTSRDAFYAQAVLATGRAHYWSPTSRHLWMAQSRRFVICSGTFMRVDVPLTMRCSAYEGCQSR